VKVPAEDALRCFHQHQTPKPVTLMSIRSRIGNSISFIGLILFVLAAIVLSEAEAESPARPIAFAIGGVSLALLAGGAWLWSSGGTPSQPSVVASQSPKLKMLGGIPGLILLLVPMKSPDLMPRFIGVALMAVTLAGFLEWGIDRKFPSAKGSWDRLRRWQKLVVSIVVIVVAFFAFVAIAMLVAKVV
jgi:hypothetical protein